MVVLNPNTDGTWDAQGLSGPAIHAPAAIRNIVITTYRVEWLNLSDPKLNFYAKNHMVAGIVFARPQWVGDKECKSARLSVEVDYDAQSDDQVPGVLPVISTAASMHMHATHVSRPDSEMRHGLWPRHLYPDPGEV